MPQAEATGEPYGISRAVVEGAAIAGASYPTPSPAGRDLNVRPVPALSQVTPTQTPDSASASGGGHLHNGIPAVDEIGNLRKCGWNYQSKNIKYLTIWKV